MKKRLSWASAVVTALALVTTPTDAFAQIGCGTYGIDHDIRQAGNYLAVEVRARTWRSWNLCLIEVQVEAWVEGAGRAATDRGVFTAEVYIGQPVPYIGIWRSQSKHWAIWNFGLYWNYLGTLWDETLVYVPQFDLATLCVQSGGTWNSQLHVCQYSNSPIIVDTAGNGYELTSVDDGVAFDLDGDGVPEQTAWTAADSDEAFLALDRNGNGRIDDGSELFGNRTRAYADEVEPTAANGFEALIFTEGPSYGRSRADLIIDSADAVFARLLLWRDANHNGVSEPYELQYVTDTALQAIETDYKLARRRDRYGNEFRQRAKSWWRGTGGVATPRYVHDVWLKSR